MRERPQNRPKNQPTNSDLRTCRSTSTHRAPETTTPTAKIYPKIITNPVTISQIKLNPSPTYKANKYQHKPTKINLQTPRFATTNSDIHYHQFVTKTQYHHHLLMLISAYGRERERQSQVRIESDSAGRGKIGENKKQIYQQQRAICLNLGIVQISQVGRSKKLNRARILGSLSTLVCCNAKST